MDYYKKKNLKFNSEVRREIRHAETVKARESSRFKRLSMLRCMDEDLEQPSFEKPEEKASKEIKKPVSRLEILHKWKHEKLVKKQLEKKQTIRPFYAGASSLITNKGMSKIGKCDQSSRDISSNSVKVSSCIPSHFSKIPNISKQVSSCNSVPTSRIPNSSKQLGAIPKTTKPQLSRNPSSNQGLAKKPTVFGNNHKTNQVLLKSKVQPGVSNPASSLNGSSSTKGFQNRPGVSNPASSLNGSSSTKGLQSRIGVFSPASSLSGSTSTKGFQSRIANPVSAVPRRIPVQSKLPVTSSQKQIAASKKLPSALPVVTKLPAVSSFQKSNPGLVKKPGLVSKVELKKAPPTSGNHKKAFPASTANARKEPLKVEKVILEEHDNEPTCPTDSKPESGLERSIDIDDVFNCDVSIINRAPSFAPENFKFQPPSEVLDFSFDISILNKIKELTSRTSTPRKQPAESPVKDKDSEELIQPPSKHLDADVQTNISTPSKIHIVIHKCYENEESMHKPSEAVGFEDNIPTPLQQRSESPVKDKDAEELIHPPSEHLDVEVKTNIITSNPVQDCKSNEDDNEIMQRSSGNVEIESNNLSPSEDLAQGSKKSPLRIILQDSCDSSQPVCHNRVASDEEMLKKEKPVAETEDLNLPSNRENRVKNRNIPSNVFQNAFQKRRSILKNSTLNSIAEADDDRSLSPVYNAGENKENILCKMVRCSRRVSNLICIDDSPSITPRRSSRISKLISIDESPSTTPRRSGRISKFISTDESPSTTPRRSLRLQNKVPKDDHLNDLNPKGSSHTNLTNDFDQLTLEDFDKMNPEDYLCDFDDSPEKIKSKKISLLYSPKRQSIRRSIRGDLMSFSPNNSPKV